MCSQEDFWAQIAWMRTCRHVSGGVFETSELQTQLDNMDAYKATSRLVTTQAIEGGMCPEGFANMYYASDSEVPLRCKLINQACHVTRTAAASSVTPLGQHRSASRTRQERQRSETHEEDPN